MKTFLYFKTKLVWTKTFPIQYLKSRMDLHFLCMLKRELRDLLGELVKNVKRAEQRVSSSSFWLAMSELCQILLWVGETLLCRNSQPTQSDRLSGHHQALWHIFLAYAVSLLPCILIFCFSIILHTHILCFYYLAYSYSVSLLSGKIIFCVFITL